MTDKKEFLRLSGGSDFQGRADVIFGNLDLLEPERKQETESQVLRRLPQHVPDHVLHPEKWTKYSLEDDGSKKLAGITGDALNKHVALSFLDNMHSRKTQSSSNRALTGETDVEMSEKHVFSRSNIKHKMEVDEFSPRSQIVDGVNVMREYVIGQSPAKSCKKEHQKFTVDADKNLEARSTVVCLQHLEDQDTDGHPENSKSEFDSEREQLSSVKFAKRKAKTRDGIRGRKSSEEDEHCNVK